MILGDRVPPHYTAQLQCVRHWKSRTQTRLHIESAESFSCVNGRHNRSIETSVFVAAGRQGSAKRGTNRIVALPGTCCGQTILEQHREISETILSSRIVLDVWRYSGIKFRVVPRNEIGAFGVSKDPSLRARWSDLTSKVGAETLDES